MRVEREEIVVTSAAALIERLDRDFDLSARFPGLPALRERWISTALEFRRANRVVEDIAYGEDALETLDLFLPDTGSLPAVAIFYHGGSWQRLDKNVFSFVAGPLLSRGIAVAVANYPLVPASTVGQIAESVIKSVRWLAANGERYGYDETRIAVSGHSAGGHLAAMVLTSAGAFTAKEAKAIRVVGMVGAFLDLQMVRLSKMNDALKLDRDSAEALSPLRRTDYLACPALITVGGAETQEFILEAEQMAATLRSRKVDADHMVFEGQDHFSIVFEIARDDHPFMKKIADRLLG